MACYERQRASDRGRVALNEVLVTVLSGGILAICSGLAFIAYEHPSEFRVVAAICNIVALLAVVLVLAIDVGVTATFDAIRPYLKDGEFGSAIQARNSASPAKLEVFIGLGLFVAYLWVLIQVVALVKGKAPTPDEQVNDDDVA